MNTYQASNGTRYPQSAINRKIKEAKGKKLQIMNDEFGYIFCTICKQNDCQPIDCSHDISVSDCKKQGRVELAWDLDNITIIGRRHHKVKDGLDLQFSSSL